MDRDFWLARWNRGEIGFHQPHPTPALTRHVAHLGPPESTRVLVPLCGKTHDLRFLHDRGHEVLGVELSEKAVEEFFQEQRLEPQRTVDHGLQRWQSGKLSILEADFFAVTPAIAGPAGAAFDRGALVALPEAMRRRYAAHLVELLEPGGVILLINFEYDASLMNGPPFSVSKEELPQLYPGAKLECLEERDILEDEPRFKQRGLTWLRESCWKITC